MWQRVNLITFHVAFHSQAQSINWINLKDMENAALYRGQRQKKNLESQLNKRYTAPYADSWYHSFPFFNAAWAGMNDYVRNNDSWNKKIFL